MTKEMRLEMIKDSAKRMLPEVRRPNIPTSIRKELDREMNEKIKFN
jgi:hypothetical protein